MTRRFGRYIIHFEPPRLVINRVRRWKRPPGNPDNYVQITRTPIRKTK